MSDDVFGRSFCLIHKTGISLYPVRMKNQDTGRVAFRISAGGTGGNTKATGQEENDESRVFGCVVNEGWAVRVASLDRKIEGLYKVGHRSITGYKDLR